jgi:HK97 family phage major capsid protein
MDFLKIMKAKNEQQTAILNKALAENRALTEDEQTQIDALEVEIKNLEKSIELQNKLDAREAASKKPENEPLFAEPKDHTKKTWNRFGDFLMAVKNASLPGGLIDNRLFQNSTGMNEQVNSEGGFMVEQDYVKQLMELTHEEGQVANRCFKMSLGQNSNGVKIPAIDETSRANGSRYGGVQSYWAGEGQTVTASKPKLKKVEIELEKLMAFCYMTGELMMDSSAMESYIRRIYPKEMAFKLDDAIINGTGAGLPLGIMNSDAKIAVAKENGQAATTIVHNNIVKMSARLYPRSFSSAAWFINMDTIPQLENMTIDIGTAGQLSPYAKEYMEKGTIKGRPVIPIEQCQTLGTTGDIILADMSQYVLIDKDSVDAQVSLHVRFLYDEQVFRFVYRVNGAPWWTSPLTPYKGSNTQSPFITLATRA